MTAHQQLERHGRAPVTRLSRCPPSAWSNGLLDDQVLGVAQSSVAAGLRLWFTRRSLTFNFSIMHNRAQNVSFSPQEVASVKFSPITASLLRPGRFRYLGRGGEGGIFSHTDAQPLPPVFGPSPSLRNTAHRLLPPLHKVDVTDWHAEFQGDWLINRNRSSIIVDAGAKLCARVPDAPYFTLDYELSRRAFEKHVNSVAFSVLPGRYAIIEAVADGRPLMHERDDDKLQVLSFFDAQLMELASADGGINASDVLQAVCEQSKIELARQRKSEIMHAFEHLPIVPVHNGLKLDHIILTDDAPVLIDFGNLRPGLGFEDLLSSVRIRTALQHTSFPRAAAAMLSSLGMESSRSHLELALITSRALTLHLKPTKLNGVAKLPKLWRKWNAQLAAELELVNSS